jgi:hypothetical protein
MLRTQIRMSAHRVRCFSLLILGLVVADAGPGWCFAHTGAPLLQFPVRARVTAMGDNGVADNSDPGNVYFNPANVVGPARVYVQGSGWDLELYDLADDLWVCGGSAGVSFEQGTRPLTLAIDISYAKFSYGESIATGPAGNMLGVYASFEQYVSVAAGVGLPLDDGVDLRVGVAAKRWWADYAPAEFTQDPAPSDSDAFAFDAGATVALPRTLSDWAVTPAMAVAFVNMGPGIDFGEDGEDPLPLRLHFGASVRIESTTTRVAGADVPVAAFVCNVDGTYRHHDEPFSWGIGTELAVAQVLFLCTGFASYPDDDSPEDESLLERVDSSGWGVGLGIPAGSFRLRADYAHEPPLLSDAADRYGVVLTWMF